MKKATILLGGLGHDAHTVGLILLRRTLLEAGYDVVYLGVQNGPRDFRLHAPGADLVMVSSLDGHCASYLDDLVPHEINATVEPSGPLWYIGGNLATESHPGLEKDLFRRGFSRVFPRYVDLKDVLATVSKDLADRGGRSGRRVSVTSPRRRLERRCSPDFEDQLNADWNLQRDCVLSQYRTGLDVPRDLDPKPLGSGVPTMSQVLRRARSRGLTLVHPRCGVQDADQQVRLFRGLQAASADILSLQVDSISRSNDYERIASILEGDTDPDQRRLLNGFPAVNHGVGTCRRVIRGARVPVQIRHGTRDPRLLAEITLAAGATGFEGGMLSYTLPYFRDQSLEDAAVFWRYVDQLCGRFATLGHTIDREYFGVLSATLVHPALAVVVNVLEALLSAEQGVGSVSVGYAEQGCRVQDVAAIRALDTLTQEYLGRAGYSSVFVSTVFHQYMAAFPEDRDLALDMVRESARTARLSGATRVMLKTYVEASKIPTLDDNVKALRVARQGMALAAGSALDRAAVEGEVADIRKIAGRILDTVIHDYDRSQELAERVIRAVHEGVVDIPFCPSAELAGKVLTARDKTGAVRFLDAGDLPLPVECRQVHRQLVEERARSLGLDADYELVEYDVTAVPDGRIKSWPLDGAGRSVNEAGLFSIAT